MRLITNSTELRAFDEWRGRDAHPSGADRKIWNLSNPKHPEYRFEWHPQSRKLYLVRMAAEPVIAEVMAFNIETHGDAINAVNIWGRGYAEGAAPQIAKTHLQE